MAPLLTANCQPHHPPPQSLTLRPQHLLLARRRSAPGPWAAARHGTALLKAHRHLRLRHSSQMLLWCPHRPWKKRGRPAARPWAAARHRAHHPPQRHRRTNLLLHPPAHQPHLLMMRPQRNGAARSCTLRPLAHGKWGGGTRRRRRMLVRSPPSKRGSATGHAAMSSPPLCQQRAAAWQQPPGRLMLHALLNVMPPVHDGLLCVNVRKPAACLVLLQQDRDRQPCGCKLHKVDHESSAHQLS